MCDKAIKIFAAITILLGLATLCPCTRGVCQSVETEESKAIAEIIYHPSTKAMTVLFRDQSAYSYDNVPATVFESFKMAESKGSFFYKNIRDQFEGELVDSTNTH